MICAGVVVFPLVWNSGSFPHFLVHGDCRFEVILGLPTASAFRNLN